MVGDSRRVIGGYGGDRGDWVGSGGSRSDVGLYGAIGGAIQFYGESMSGHGWAVGGSWGDMCP